MQPATSHDVGAESFVKGFYAKSRLHFIGTWKERFEELLGTLETPPQQQAQQKLQHESVVFHVDMDAFFCSVSLTQMPEEMKAQPCAVSWPGGEISSCNYIARGFGVKAGMWGKKAKELCPNLQTLEFDFPRYADVAENVYRELFRLSPLVIGVSVDEAYIDVTSCITSQVALDAENANEVIFQLAETLRARIFEVSGGCTASVGIGPNRLISRFATKKAKPNGVFLIKTPKEFLEIVASSHVRELPGVGYRTESKLNELGITTCGELAATKVTRQLLENHFGSKAGKSLFDLVRGIDHRPWEPLPERKSIGAQISWGVRMNTNEEVKAFLEELSKQVVARLVSAKKEQGGQGIGLKVWRAVPDAPDHMRKGKVGHGICTILQRSSKLSAPTGTDANLIAKVSFELYLALSIEATEVRGMGVTVMQLVSSADQSGSLKRRKPSSPSMKPTAAPVMQQYKRPAAAGRAKSYGEKAPSASAAATAGAQSFVFRTRLHQHTISNNSTYEHELVRKLSFEEMKSVLDQEIHHAFEHELTVNLTGLEKAVRECYRLLRMFGNELQHRSLQEGIPILDLAKKRDSLLDFCEMCLDLYNPSYLPSTHPIVSHETGQRCYKWFKKNLQSERNHQIGIHS